MQDSGNLWPTVETKQTPKELKLSLKDVDLEIDRAFLRNPPRFETLTSLEDALRNWLIGAGAEAPAAKSIAERLHAYFLEEFHDE